MINSKILNEDVKNIYEHLTNTEEKNLIPIRRGCRNKQCFCTGKCDEIIGYREKELLEPGIILPNL